MAYRYTEYSWIVNDETGETIAIIPSTGGQEAQQKRAHTVVDALNNYESGAVRALVDSCRRIIAANPLPATIDKWKPMHYELRLLSELLAPFAETEQE